MDTNKHVHLTRPRCPMEMGYTDRARGQHVLLTGGLTVHVSVPPGTINLVEIKHSINLKDKRCCPLARTRGL